jgi:hypothetical protein
VDELIHIRLLELVGDGSDLLRCQVCVVRQRILLLLLKLLADFVNGVSHRCEARGHLILLGLGSRGRLLSGFLGEAAGLLLRLVHQRLGLLLHLLGRLTHLLFDLVCHLPAFLLRLDCAGLF